MSDIDFDIEKATGELESRVCTTDIQSEWFDKMEIESTNINQGCMDQAGMMMEAVLAYETASEEVDRLKDTISHAEAFLDPQARQLIIQAGDKITESKVTSVIKTHHEYLDIQARYHAAKANAGKWKAVMDGVRHRKDMLVTIANNYRAEGHSDISIRSLDMQEKMAKAREIVNGD